MTEIKNMNLEQLLDTRKVVEDELAHVLMRGGCDTLGDVLRCTAILRELGVKLDLEREKLN